LKRPLIQVIQTGIFDQLDQAYWLFSFTKKIHSFGARRNINARVMQTGVPQCCVLSPTLFKMYINDGPQTHGIHLALFAEDSCLYSADRKEVFTVRKLQRGLSSMETRCERWKEPCDLQKLISYLKLRKSCGIDGIPYACLRRLPRRPLVHLTHLFNHCLRLSHFPNPWKEAKVITLPKPSKDPKFPQNLRPIRLLSTKGKLFEKVILQLVQEHIEERGLLKANQFGFRARHSTTLQRIRLTDQVTLNLNKTSLLPRCSWTLKKPLMPHGTLACYTSGIFDQLGQASFLFSFRKKIQDFGRRRNVNAKSNASRGVIRFGPVPYTFQHVYK
jgi:hypothetical protein